ncbi:flagellar protein FlaG [Brevibacillus gelatini]|uniref:Flagellar protein FlaG n=2 Tax=Brevibacillus gelatini TaxID=1655277 RepID=A0A3M8ARQ8_9BACL|nr:flagellar protein FlaG [Brevibacillus gelatini]
MAANGRVPYVEKLAGGSGSQHGVQQQENKAPVQTDKHFSKADIERQVESLNKFMQSSTTHLKFTLHEELNEYYVQVVSDIDNTVVREIPSKKMMDMVAKMHEMIGLLVDEKR